MRKMSNKFKRDRMRKKLKRKARNVALRGFVKEVKARRTEGYSMRQLLDSHIPDIGVEVKVRESEVSHALRVKEATESERKSKNWGRLGGIIFLLA